MPRYFFDITDAGRQTRDISGTDLADDGEARDEAISLLTSMVRDVLPDGDRHEILVEVRDSADAIVYEARLTLDGKWWPGRR